MANYIDIILEHTKKNSKLSEITKMHFEQFCVQFLALTWSRVFEAGVFYCFCQMNLSIRITISWFGQANHKAHKTGTGSILVDV